MIQLSDILPYVVSIATFFVGSKTRILANRKTEIDIWRDLANRLEKELTKVQNEVVVLKEDNAKLLKAVNKLDQDVSKYRTDNENLEKRYKQLERDYNKLKSQTP